MDNMASKDIQTRIIENKIFVKIGMDKWRVLFINDIRYVDRFDNITTVITKNEDVYLDDVEKILEELNNDEKVEGI